MPPPTKEYSIGVSDFEATMLLTHCVTLKNHFHYKPQYENFLWAGMAGTGGKGGRQVE